jgi:aerobic-type carbon monoxide dehydrogenase small subunit (CoxS/CutS family)
MISLTVNGKEHKVDVPEDITLLWVLRDYLGLMGTKFGCGIGECGSCTVLIEGKTELSCQISAEDAEGVSITTIEGLPENHPVKRAWIEDQMLKM